MKLVIFAMALVTSTVSFGQEKLFRACGRLGAEYVILKRNPFQIIIGYKTEVESLQSPMVIYSTDKNVAMKLKAKIDQRVCVIGTASKAPDEQLLFNVKQLEN